MLLIPLVSVFKHYKYKLQRTWDLVYHIHYCVTDTENRIQQRGDTNVFVEWTGQLNGSNILDITFMYSKYNARCFNLSCNLFLYRAYQAPVTTTTGHCFLFGSVLSFFLELFLHWSPVAYCTLTDLGSSSFSILSFCLFILFMGFSRQEYWSGLPFPSPVDYVLSELWLRQSLWLCRTQQTMENS